MYQWVAEKKPAQNHWETQYFRDGQGHEILRLDRNHQKAWESEYF